MNDLNKGDIVKVFYTDPLTKGSVVTSVKIEEEVDFLYFQYFNDDKKIFLKDLDRSFRLVKVSE